MCKHINSHMPNVTLSIPIELHKKMKKHSDVRWSEIVRRSIAERVETLELMDKIASKSKLTMEDIEEINEKVKLGVYKRLHENSH